MSQGNQMRPVDPGQAPDPSVNYERSHPERESASGGLDAPEVAKATPGREEDRMDDAVLNRQDPQRTFNADEGGHGRTHAVERGKATAQTGSGSDLPVPGTVASQHLQPDHSMREEEPTGWDQAPTEPAAPEFKRHPRTGGKGGTPDEREPLQQG